jgi:hypothetical protein
MLKAMFSAIAISIINAAVAVIIIKIALKKDWKKFNKLVFGSMVVRYFLILITLWICYQVFDLDKFTFSLTFILSTFVLLFLEILFLHYRANFLILQNRINK